MFFSIIIPCYNSAYTIERLFVSLSKQSFKDYEIIAINDGSSDNTLKVLNNEALINTRLTVIDSSNNGPLSARIKGIQNATGDYLIFVDSDDVIESNMLEILYNVSQQYNKPDVIAFNNSRKIINDASNDYKTEIITKNRLWEYGGFGLWNKIYKRKEYDFSFLLTEYKSLKINEDFLLSFELMKNASSIIKIHKSLYVYLSNEQSTTSNHQKDPCRIMRMEAFDYILNNMLVYGYGISGFKTLMYESCEKFKDRLLTISGMDISNSIKKQAFKVGAKSNWYKKYKNYYYKDYIWKSKMMNKKQKIYIVLYRLRFYTLIIFISKRYLR